MSCVCSPLSRLRRFPHSANAALPALAAAATYTVAPGETLGHIARRFGVGVDELMASNGIKNADAVRAGASLALPANAKDSQPKMQGLDETLRYMAAGGLAGVTVETVLFPLDTIKTRLQAAKAGKGLDLRGLYSGLSGNIPGCFTASAIFFGVYDPMKKQMEELWGKGSTPAHLVSAASAGLASSVVRVPTEVVKQRLQTGQFKGPVEAVKTIFAKEGARGFTRGYGAFLLRDLPFDAIEFVAYEGLKAQYTSVMGRRIEPVEASVLGGVAGAFTGAVTTPLDVLKTRFMTGGTAVKYKNLLDAAVTISREEGWRALFAGVQPRVTWIGIGGFIFFGCLEKSREVLGVVS